METVNPLLEMPNPSMGTANLILETANPLLESTFSQITMGCNRFRLILHLGKLVSLLCHELSPR